VNKVLCKHAAPASKYLVNSQHTVATHKSFSTWEMIEYLPKSFTHLLVSLHTILQGFIC